MARYTGPKHKFCRKFGVKLCDSPKCPAIRRPYRAGQHGPKGNPRISEYGTQLAEKQKARMLYGILERQFRTYFKKATAQSGDTGANLLKILEQRLDNTLYRSGLAQTRRMARQLVAHGHIIIDNRKVTIPSYQCKKGNTIKLRDKAEKLTIIVDAKKRLKKQQIPSWLSFESQDPIKLNILNEPDVEHLGTGVNTSLIVEFYSR